MTSHPRFLAACRVLAIAVVALAAPELAAQASSTDEQRVADLQRRLAEVERSAGARNNLEIDPASLDVGFVADTLDRRSPQAAFDWVRESLSFDPYEGRMRGVRGALFTRGGNSLDRSLVLGALLDELRVEWRLARTQLDYDMAARLLEGATLRGEFGGPDAPEFMRRYQTAEDLRHLNVVRRHYWVEARIGGEWQAMDTTYPGFSIGQAVTSEPERFEPDDLPPAERLEATVTIFYITQAGEGGIALRHSGDMTDICYRNLSLSFLPGAGGAFRPVLSVRDEVYPGQPIPALALGVEQLWVEFFFRLGEYERRVTRDLYVADASLNLFDTEQQVFSMVLLPGFVGPDYYRAVLIAFLGELVDTTETGLDAVMAGARLEQTQQEVEETLDEVSRDVLGGALGIAGLTFATVSDAAALRLGELFGVRPFYDQPRVLITAAYRIDGSLFYQIDLRANDIDGMPWIGMPQSSYQAFHAYRGRLDSSLEGGILSLVTGAPVLTLADLMDQAEAQSIDRTTLYFGNVDRIDELPYSPEAQLRLSREINDSGYVTYAPERPVEFGDTSFLGWWRVEPATGNIIGVKENGSHGAEGALAGAEREADAGGTPSVRTATALVSLLESLVDGTLRVGESGVELSPVACETRCDLQQLSRRVCSEVDPGSMPNAGRCLRGENDDGDLIRLNASCGTLVSPFRCGSIVGDAVLAGQLTVDRTSDAPFAGPWGDGVIDALSVGACTCQGAPATP